VTLRVLSDVLIPTRDGVRLATDIYLPDGEGPFPALMERTPYDRRGTNHADRSRADPIPKPKPDVARRFAEAGFAYVLQDCRGRYGSEGTFTKYLGEGEDGADTLAWIRAQPWCNGRIGTLGLSYGAHVQTALAALAPAGLAAMFIDSGGFSSAYHSGIRQGGAYELKQLTWAMKHALLDPETRRDPRRHAALAEQKARAWLTIDPWQAGASPLAAAPEYERYVLDQWRHESFDEFWNRPELYALGYHDRFPDIPQVHLSSWYDPYARTAVENFLSLRAQKRAPVSLILGPWCHGQRSVTYAGDVDFGTHAPLDGALAEDYTAFRLGFFDRHLRQRVTGQQNAAVSYFLMGGGSGRRNQDGRLDHGGAWRFAGTWPPEDTRPAALFLGPGQALGASPPAQGGRAAWIYDPTAPVPTIGGATASGAPLMVAGAFDQRETSGLFGPVVPGRALTSRPDTVFFDSPVLTGAVAIAGRFTARIWVSTDVPDTDIMMTLMDIHPPSADYPDGYAMNLAHGVLRLRFRDGFGQPRPLVPGEPVQVTIEGFPTANRFLPGHRLRVMFTSSNFPHFDVNPNSGAPAGMISPPRTAHTAILFGPDHSSHIMVDLLAGDIEWLTGSA